MSETAAPLTLAEHPFTKGLSASAQARLESHARPFQVAANKYLAREGQPAAWFYLIASGHVTISTSLGERGAATLQTLGPGEVVGWSWLMPPYRWQFDVRALDAVEGLALDAAGLRSECERDHELGYQLLKQLLAVVGDRLAACRIRILDIYK
jgi:CRP-like cAMP-binding protein